MLDQRFGVKGGVCAMFRGHKRGFTALITPSLVMLKLVKEGKVRAELNTGS